MRFKRKTADIMVNWVANYGNPIFLSRKCLIMKK